MLQKLELNADPYESSEFFDLGLKRTLLYPFCFFHFIMYDQHNILKSNAFFTGLHFTLDPSSCLKRELVFSRDLSVVKLTSPVSASVMSHVTLSNGCHYWKVRIDQFVGTSNNGFVAFGVAKELDDGGPIGKMRCMTFKFGNNIRVGK